MTEADSPQPQPNPECPSTQPVPGDRSGDELSAEKIGPYSIVRELGRGGQGLVYLAEDTRLGRRVALKVLTSWGAATEQVVERFRREAAIASRLEHPGICTVYETGTAQGVPYMAMRLVEGESLSNRIATSTTEGVSEALSFIDLEDEEPTADTEADAPTSDTAAQTTQAEILRIAKLMEAAARALHTAHEAGVIHRDIKPGNIMITPDGDPVLLDFGLARESDGDQPTLTQTGDIFGTPAYMAPEQLLAQRMQVDRRADVWALGVTLFECLCLKRPFEAPTRDGLYQQILHRDPPDLRKLNKSIPKDLAVIVQTATEKDRDRRYQTALDFAEDLRRFRTFEPIQAKPVGQLTKLVRWTQRNPAVATLTAALFFAMATGLAFIWSQNTALQAKTEEAQASATALRRSNQNLEAKTAEAEANARLAEQKAQEAQANAAALQRSNQELEATTAESQANLTEWERLADGRRLDDLVEEANGPLWPAVPNNVTGYGDWLTRARALTAKLPEHEAALETLRAQGSYDEAADRQRLAVEHQRLATLAGDLERAEAEVAKATAAADALQGQMDALEDKQDQGRLSRAEQRALLRLETQTETATAAAIAAQTKVSDLHAERERLQAVTSIRFSWAFTDEGDQLRHDKLRDLVAGLVALTAEPTAKTVTVAGMEQRLNDAVALKRRLAADDAASWRRCLADLSRPEPPYHDLKFRPIPGLVPLGRDRDSGLWEFWHVASGKRPHWDGELLGLGKVRLHPDSGAEGIVMVLLPAGSFRMGAVRPDAVHPKGSPNVDHEAKPDEGPVHEVTLDAYLIAKHEVTQGQWVRLWGENPTHYRAGSTYNGQVATLRMPVSDVSWRQSWEACRRWGLQLPTEAQWERACRAGTTTRFFTGNDLASLRGFANIADASRARNHTGPAEIRFDDGVINLAPVSALQPNPFGLHDVHGNVWEWCRDGYDSYESNHPRPGHGLRTPWRTVRECIIRGGSFRSMGLHLRAACREQHVPDWMYFNVGFRAALGVAQ